MEPFFLPKNDKNCTVVRKVRIETYGCQMLSLIHIFWLK